MRARTDIMVREERPALAAYQPQQAPFVPEMPEPSLIKAIFRHFWMVIVCALLGAGGAVLYIRNAIPLYSSESLIYIQPMGPRVLNETIGTNQRATYNYTQAQQIMSTPVLAMVAATPGIRELKTFEITGGDPIPYLRDELAAEVGRRDDTISVSVASPYPEDAATIVNAVVDVYTKHSSRARDTRSGRIVSTLEQRKIVADKDLAEREAKMAEFEKTNANQVLDPAYQAELAMISRTYTEAQIRTLDAATKYEKNHPVLLQARKNEEQLYTAYQTALRKVMNLNLKTAEYQKMKTELDARRQFVARLDEVINEKAITQQAEQNFDHVEVIEPARVADAPSFPRKKRTMAVAVVAGMLVGAGLALLRDRLDGRLRSIEEIQTVIGLPILGVVPGMSGRRTAVARAMAVHLDPRSPVAEAYRTIRTAVYFGVDGARCKTILVTSPEPGDGKTTSASNLAIAIAQTGRSVLLLDADFRKPSQHKNLEIKDAVGLSSVLAGHETLERAIQHTGVEGLDILPCGPIPANPSEILNSREFGELVDSLAARYDHILFDSPPVNAVTDARILGAVCDATILVLRADKSTRKAGEHARNALLGVGSRVLGAIVNAAPHKRGYEVYGGSYYGSTEVSPHQADPDAGIGSARTPAGDAV